MSEGFQFKQFFIQHDQCAMKVGTDSIMLGSWVQAQVAKSILDIGTGSGILAIMLAQKSLPDAKITAIDFDQDAIKQAALNGKHSTWPDKITFQHTSIQEFSANHKFDLIVSNPPYFKPKEGELLTSDPQFIESKRRTARHTFELTHADLVFAISRLLSDKGQCYLVLPEQECEAFEQLLETSELFVNQQLLVCPTEQKGVIRRLLRLSRMNSKMVSERLNIHGHDGKYSKQYRTLCKDFYLNF